MFLVLENLDSVSACFKGGFSESLMTIYYFPDNHTRVDTYKAFPPPPRARMPTVRRWLADFRTIVFLLVHLQAELGRKPVELHC